MHELPKGFEVPIHRALTTPLLMAGVPREFAILNGTGTMAAGMGMHQLWAVPIGLVIHLLARVAAKYDPQFFEVTVRHLKHRRYYEA
jgi:type IV secretory pathway TrbD component